MTRTRNVLLLVFAGAALAFGLSGCVSFRYSNSLFNTGRVLDPGKSRIGVRTQVYPALFPGEAYYQRGFPGGWQVTAGYGIHGIEDTSTSTGGSSTLQGPELTVTKTLVNARDIFYLGATGGADIDLTPKVGALLYAGLDAGVYPFKWLTIYAQAKGAYLVGGIPGMLLALGAGIDGPFTLKVAGYYTPLPITSNPNSTTTSPEVFWPFGIAAEAGIRF